MADEAFCGVKSYLGKLRKYVENIRYYIRFVIIHSLRFFSQLVTYNGIGASSVKRSCFQTHALFFFFNFKFTSGRC